MNAAFMLGLGLIACPAEPRITTEQPDTCVTLAAAQHVQVNAQALASIISNFRREHGLGPVTVDPEHQTAQAVFIAKVLAKAKGNLTQSEVRAERFRLYFRKTDGAWRLVRTESPELKFD